MTQENCPWCAEIATMKKIFHGNEWRYSVYAMCCDTCGSRGPVLNVSPDMESNKEMMNEIEALIHQRYIKRRPWDDGLINQYDDDKND